MKPYFAQEANREIKTTKVFMWILIIVEIIHIFLVIIYPKYWNGFTKWDILMALNIFCCGSFFISRHNRLSAQIPKMLSYEIFQLTYNKNIVSAYIMWFGFTLSLVKISTVGSILFACGLVWYFLCSHLLKKQWAKTLTKEQAMEALNVGFKLKHPLFTGEDYIYSNSAGDWFFGSDHRMIDKDLFRNNHTVEAWETGWEIYE